MLKKIFIAAFLAAGVSFCNAQTDTVKTKNVDYYIGVQANQLLKQLLNLSNSNTVISNPYLINFSANLSNSGWGMQGGMGYNYQKTEDKNTPAAKVTKANDLFYRIGIGRRMMISKRFEAGYGFDIVGDGQHDKTFSSSVINFGNGTDSSVTVVSSKINTTGFGFQLSLGFHISRKIILRTESTYYYNKSKQKQNILVTDTSIPLFGDPTVSTLNTNLETEISKVTFTVPVAIFLTVKF